MCPLAYGNEREREREDGGHAGWGSFAAAGFQT